MLDPTLAKLSTSEKLLLVEDLWDSIATSKKGLPVTAQERAYVRERLASLRKRKYKTTEWSILKKQLGL
jgi:putative addiction module component (TIGR02574 family)